MPAWSERFSAVSTAFPALLVSCWKARHSCTSSIHSTSSRKLPYSSIADAMLGRAIQNYEPPPQANKVLPARIPSGPAAIHGKFAKSSKPSSQNSLINFTKSTSSGPFKQTTSPKVPSVGAKSLLKTTRTGARKRTSSEMGVFATLSKTGSFQDMTNTREGLELQAKSSLPFDIDPNDFDDDDDLDLDVQYAIPLPTTEPPREPLVPLSTNTSQASTLNVATITPAAGSKAPDSSMTWSSSPISHKVTPPGASRRRQFEEDQKPPMPLVSSELSIDADARPPKRRTVPWLDREARRQEADRDTAETATNLHSKQSPGEKFTPLSKDPAMPWNTSASAIKNQQKAFKDLQKKTSKPKKVATVDEMKHAVMTSHNSRPNPICLSDEQNEVLNLVKEKNKSVFFTGSAGTGKSVLMRSIIGELRKKYAKEPDRVAVTASTGLAACNIGGVTLHSFAGIGLGKESVDELKKKIAKNAKTKNRWLRTKVLIIDEISMVDGDLFDKLEALARFIRKNGRPFGGIQIVVTGDFFQLPPVPGSHQRDAKFAFDAGSWSTVIHHTIRLTEVFRQRDPSKFSFASLHFISVLIRNSFCKYVE